MHRKYEIRKKKFNHFFLNISKIHKKFKQHQYKKLYSTPHDMVHIPGKFRENTAMLFRVTVQKLNVTGRTDGGACQYLLFRAFGAAGDNKATPTESNSPAFSRSSIVKRI